MDIFEWQNGMSVTAEDLNEMQNILNSNIPTQIANAQEWQYLGETSNNTSLALPASYSEILAIVNVDNNTNVGFSFLIPEKVLGTSNLGFNSGYYQGSTTHAHCRVLATKTTISIGVAYLNGTNKLTTSTMKVYYR